MTVDDLYGLPREEFIPARRELARQAKADGDKDRAAEIEKLAKPTTAAWLVNQLTREHPDEVEDLLAVGADLRAAHGQVSGAGLRELTKRRGELIRDLVALAGGPSLTESITRELEDMLTAAVADESAGEVLRAGRITTAKDLAITPTWPGLAMAPPPAKPAERTEPKPERKKADPAAARKAAIAEAKAQVKAAETERASADKAIDNAEKAVAAAEKKVRELNAELDAAELSEMEARRALQLARRDAKSAERAASQAWRKLSDLQS